MSVTAEIPVYSEQIVVVAADRKSETDKVIGIRKALTKKMGKATVTPAKKPLPETTKAKKTDAKSNPKAVAKPSKKVAVKLPTPPKKPVISQAQRLQNRVEPGKAFLDKKMPDWFRKVSPNALNATSEYNCIAGQLFRQEGVPAGILSLMTKQQQADYTPEQFGRELGITQDVTNANKLNDLWAEAIAVRLAL